MHARELVELAASVTTHVESILTDPMGISGEGLQTYWIQSKKRLDAWATLLISFEETTAVDTTAGTPSSSGVEDTGVEDMLRLAEEVLISEILTRIWAAVVSGASYLPTLRASAATARSVFVHHQEIRLRILKWMVAGPVAESPAVEAVNLLRRRCERWTDLFLGRIALVTEVSHYAFDRDRLADYQNDFEAEHEAGTLHTSWNTLLASLSSTFDNCLQKRPICRETNTEIALAILICLGPNTMDDWGSLRWSWLHRIERVFVDTQHLIDDLLVTGRSTAKHGQENPNR